MMTIYSRLMLALTNFLFVVCSHANPIDGSSDEYKFVTKSIFKGFEGQLKTITESTNKSAEGVRLQNFQLGLNWVGIPELAMAETTSTARTKVGTLISGKTNDNNGGYFNLIVKPNNEVTGTVVFNNKTTLLGQENNKSYALTIDTFTLPNEAPPVIEVFVPGTPVPDSAPVSQEDSLLMRVLVAYTDAAAAATWDIDGDSALAISEANIALGNSGIMNRFELAGTYVTNYNETGNANADLKRLKNDSDGYMDDVINAKYDTEAEIVMLITDRSNYCGLAYLLTSYDLTFRDSTFGLVRRDCATAPQYSFTHELGHLVGARHDSTNSYDTGINTYSFGHINTTSPAFRTVMSYNTVCENRGVSCPRLLNFSNPNLSNRNRPLGTDTENNARSLKEVLPWAGNY